MSLGGIAVLILAFAFYFMMKSPSVEEEQDRDDDDTGAEQTTVKDVLQALGQSGKEAPEEDATLFATKHTEGNVQVASPTFALKEPLIPDCDLSGITPKLESLNPRSALSGPLVHLKFSRFNDSLT